MKIYLVVGELDPNADPRFGEGPAAGEDYESWDDFQEEGPTEWVVVAYPEEEFAQEHARRATEWAKNAKAVVTTDSRGRHPTLGAAPYDPHLEIFWVKMPFQSGNTFRVFRPSYRVDAVEFFRHPDEWLETNGL